MAPVSKVPTRHRMRVFSLLAALAALIAAALAVSSTGTVTGQQDATWVLRAKRTIQPLTVLSRSAFEPTKVSKKDLVAGAITAGDKESLFVKARIPRAVAQLPIPRNSQLTRDMVDLTRNIRPPLEPYERLMAIEASPVTSLGSRLRPGDTVDVLFVSDEAGTTTGGQLLVSNVRIVAVAPPEEVIQAAASAEGNGTDEKDLPDTKLPGLFLVRVRVEAAQALAVAQQAGKMYLLLRGPNAANTATNPTSSTDLLCSPTFDNASGTSQPGPVSPFLSTLCG